MAPPTSTASAPYPKPAPGRRSKRQENPIAFPAVPCPSVDSAHAGASPSGHQHFSLSQLAGSSLSEPGRFDDPECENVSVASPYPRTPHPSLPAQTQSTSGLGVHEDWNPLEDSEDQSFDSAEEFFSANEYPPPATHTAPGAPRKRDRERPAAGPSRSAQKRAALPAASRKGRGGRGVGAPSCSIPPPPVSRAARPRSPAERTTYTCGTEPQDRPITVPPAPSSQRRASPTEVLQGVLKSKANRPNDRFGTREPSAEIYRRDHLDRGWNDSLLPDRKVPKGKAPRRNPDKAQGGPRPQPHNFETYTQQSSTKRPNVERPIGKNRLHEPQVGSGSRQTSRESSFNWVSSFENPSPSTAPTSAQSSFSRPKPGPSQQSPATGVGYFSDATEEDEGWERMEQMPGFPRSGKNKQLFKEPSVEVVEEADITAAEEALREHLAEEAELIRMRQEFEVWDSKTALRSEGTHRLRVPAPIAQHFRVEESEYEDDISEGLVCELAQLDLDGRARVTTSYSGPRRPFTAFKFLLQYEVTRVSLSLGKSPEECETQVPIIAENFGHVFHNAETKRVLWDSMKLFGQSLATDGKSMPEPLSDEFWLLLNDCKHNCWTNEIELTGTASFDLKAKGFDPHIRLNPLVKNKGHKFAHRFGSDRFLTLRIPLDPLRMKGKDPGQTGVRDKMVEWLVTKELRLVNRDWRCFYVKGNSAKKGKELKEDVGREALNPEKSQRSENESFLLAYFFAESGVGLGEPSYLVQEQLGFLKDVKTSQDEMIRAEMSRNDLIRWHMPLEKHMGNTFAKIWSRIALGTSTACPTVTFHPEKITYIPDIVSTDNNVMTDGCAVCSPKVMRIIREKLGLDETPTAVQARLGGAKGIWFVDPSADRYSEEVSITIRDSQLKFRPHDSDTDPDTMDWARLTLFVLHYSKTPSPASLNMQFIPILAYGGVPFEVFKELLGKHLDEDLENLLSVASDRISLRSWLSQNGVMSDRHKNGYIPQYSSGTPQSSQELISMLLDARFEPLQCGFLMDKLKAIVAQQCSVILDGLHIRVPSSTTVFCIADPTGTLEEGEVSLQFSMGFLDGNIQTRLDCIESDVLVARNPAHLPTDMQKVRAVCPTHPGLRRLKDVIVFSTKGRVPLADKLSGGDYDGDKIWVCWDRRLVGPFKNNPSIKAYKKKFDLMEDIDHGGLFLKDLGQDPSSPLFCNEFFSRGFVSSLMDNYLGICTDVLTRYTYHEYPRVKYVDMTVMQLAHLCSSLVDAPKQGKRPKRETVAWLNMLSQKYGSKPAYKTPNDASNSPVGNPEEWYILDRLILDAGKSKVAEKEAEFTTLMDRQGTWTDPHLTRRFHTFDAASMNDGLLRRVRAKLSKDLEQLQNTWAARLNRQSKGPDFSFAAEVDHIHTTFLGLKPPKETLVDPRVRHWHDTADRPNSEWRLIKASMLFYMNRKKQKLPWWVALPELCFMKAEESSIDLRCPAPRAVVDDMYLVLKPPSQLLGDIDEVVE